MLAPTDLKNRLMILAMPVGMVLLWLVLIARGDGRLDGLGNPVGGDFAMFYIAGQMASQGEWQLLYNEPEQQQRLIALFPGLPLDTYLPYRYPPLLAMLLAPLGSLPYRAAQVLWCMGSLLVWLLSWWALSRSAKAHGLAGQPGRAPENSSSFRCSPFLLSSAFQSIGLGTPRSLETQRKGGKENGRESTPHKTGRNLRCPALAPCGMVVGSPLANTCLIGLVASPIMAQTLIDGQASFWWFAVLTFTWLSIHRKRFVLAGVCLALAACKPNVLLLVGVMLIVRYPRILLGVLPTGLLMLVATWLFAGRECLTAYVELASQLATQSWSVETPYWKVQSLLSWTQPLLGSAARPIDLIIGLVIVLAVGYWWRERDSRSVKEVDKLRHAACALSLGLLTNALFNPYTPVYDLMLLSLGMFAWLVYAEHAGVLSHWLDNREIKMMIACMWVGPIVSQCLARELACPQQWMTAVMVIAMVAVGLPRRSASPRQTFEAV